MSMMTDQARAAASFTALLPDLRTHILTYLDGRSLLYCACVCRELEHLVDNRELWEPVAWKEHPHLADTLDKASYGEEWRPLFMDRNRRNRSISVQLSVRNVDTESWRQSIRLNEYTFELSTLLPGQLPGEMGVTLVLSCFKQPAEGQEPPVEPAAWICWVSADFQIAQGTDNHTFRRLGRLDLGYDSVIHSTALLGSIIPQKVLDPAEGYVHGGAINLKVILKLLYIRVEVFTRSSMMRHQGFGVLHFKEQDTSRRRTYELPYGTTLKESMQQLKQDLGRPSDARMRLWVSNQPSAADYLAPRHALPLEEEVEGSDVDNDEGWPVLLSTLLEEHIYTILIDSYPARIWAEVSSDGGLYLDECSTPDVPLVGASSPPDLPYTEGEKPSLRLSESDPLPRINLKEPHACKIHLVHEFVDEEGKAESEETSGGSGDTGSKNKDGDGGQVLKEGDEGGGSGDEAHGIIFLKWLDPETGHLTYLTHAVARLNTTRLHSLLHQISALVDQPLALLSLHREALPSEYQVGHTEDVFLQCEVPVCQSGRTLADVGLATGSIVAVYLTTMIDRLREVYQGYLQELFRDARVMLHGADVEGTESGMLVSDNTGHKHPRHDAGPTYQASSTPAIGMQLPRRLQPLRLPDVLAICERMGIQAWRVDEMYRLPGNQSARQVLTFIARGRHLLVCCDRCGASDFTGPRFTCQECDDYDLCGQCKALPVAFHKYGFERRSGWVRRNVDGTSTHADHHRMRMCLPIPADRQVLNV